MSDPSAPARKASTVDDIAVQLNDLMMRLAKTASGRVVASAAQFEDAEKLTAGLNIKVIDIVKNALAFRYEIGRLIPIIQELEKRL